MHSHSSDAAESHSKSYRLSRPVSLFFWHKPAVKSNVKGSSVHPWAAPVCRAPFTQGPPGVQACWRTYYNQTGSLALADRVCYLSTLFSLADHPSLFSALLSMLPSFFVALLQSQLAHHSYAPVVKELAPLSSHLVQEPAQRRVGKCETAWTSYVWFPPGASFTGRWNKSGGTCLFVALCRLITEAITAVRRGGARATLGENRNHWNE